MVDESWRESRRVIVVVAITIVLVPAAFFDFDDDRLVWKLCFGNRLCDGGRDGFGDGDALSFGGRAVLGFRDRFRCRLDARCCARDGCRRRGRVNRCGTLYRRRGGSRIAEYAGKRIGNAFEIDGAAKAALRTRILQDEFALIALQHLLTRAHERLGDDVARTSDNRTDVRRAGSWNGEYGCSTEDYRSQDDFDHFCIQEGTSSNDFDCAVWLTLFATIAAGFYL